MSNAHDRRAPGTARMPFDAMVEMVGTLGPSYEAQAVNLSEEGMQLRGAYLPEVGQPVMCRFDAGQDLTVTAAGEVLWREDLGDGGEFGIRFTNLDGASTVALQRVLGMVEDAAAAPAPGAVANEPGRKVRLHIEGLASPMRARIKDVNGPNGVTAYTELGFLRMDRPLELEDAASGGRRPAMIEKVEVAVDGNSKIPQLVFGLRYDDEEARAARAPSMSSIGAMEVPVEQTPHDTPSDMHARSDESDEVPAEEGGEPAAAQAEAMDDTDEESSPNKFKLAMAKVSPVISGWAARAKVAAALIAAKARRAEATGQDVEIPVRRTTAPAPGGGLHTDGRRVVRGATIGSIHEERFEESDETKPKLKITKKRAAIAGTIGVAAILVFFAVKKPAPTEPLASAPPAETANANATPAPAAPPTEEPAPAMPVPPPNDPLAAQALAPKPAGKPGKVTPFTNGPVGSRPNTIKIKMDGPIEAIQGATQPAGFTIVLPNRKTAEPATSLADKDPRLAGLNVSNEASGAELTVTFKDGVPNYIVRAKNDVLEVVLAGSPSHAERSQARETKKKPARTKKR